MQHFWPDIRFGVRMLLRHPTLSFASILTFGLGLGLATSVFSLVNGGLLKGLPVEEPDRVVTVVATDPQRHIRRGAIEVRDLAAIEERQTVFESLGGLSTLSVNLSGDGIEAERVRAAAMEVGALRALRVAPVLGRLFEDGEDRPGAEPVMLLGHRVWQERFAGAPGVIGRTMRANGVARTIVGVLPAGFAFPIHEEVWIPLVADPPASPPGQGPAYQAVGRLRAGTSLREARAQMDALVGSLEGDFFRGHRAAGIAVVPFIESVLGSDLFGLIYTMLAAGVGVLLIACVNVSNLLLARASLRQREVAVRLALGAGRRRILAQVLTEVTLLAAAGALVGLTVSIGFVRWFVAAVRSNPPPFFVTFDLDLRVLLFVTAVTGLAALSAGLFPALQAARLDVAGSLKDEGRSATSFRTGRLGGGLIVAEMAASCALLVTAGLMVKSVVEVRTADLPFTVNTITTARVSLSQSHYPDAGSRHRFAGHLLETLQATPAVAAAALSDALPASAHDVFPVEVEGVTHPGAIDAPVVRRGIVTPGYFELFGTRVLAGREFTTQDRAGHPMVALVNETFARRFFGAADPIGRRIRAGGDRLVAPWLTVVGLVPDMLMQGFRNTAEGAAGYYVPVGQSEPGLTLTIALRGRSRAAEGTAAALRDAVAALDPDLALFAVRPMRDVLDQQTMFHSVFGTLFLAFGAAGLFLASAGLYGVMSFAVTARTRELGIRAAIGAHRSQLVLLVMRTAILQSLAGLSLGLALGLLIALPLQPLLYRVHPRDPVVLVSVIAVLAGTGLLTGLLATWRLTRLDPAAALQ